MSKTTPEQLFKTTESNIIIVKGLVNGVGVIGSFRCKNKMFVKLPSLNEGERMQLIGRIPPKCTCFRKFQGSLLDYSP